VRHSGIAYRHPEKCTVGDLIHALAELWRTRTAEDMIDQMSSCHAEDRSKSHAPNRHVRTRQYYRPASFQ
jgi:hypothetical protein